MSSLLCIFQLSSLRFNFEFENFFQEDNPDIRFYEKHREIFGYDNDYLLVVLEAEETVFNTEFLQRTEEWYQKAKNFEGVKSGVSPTGLKRIVKSPYGIVPIPLLHTASAEKLKGDSVRALTHPFYNNFFADNAGSVLVWLNHKHFNDPVVEQKFISDLKQSLDAAGFFNYRLIGKLIAQQSFIGYIQKDFTLFLSLGLALTAILLILIYRSFKIMLLPYVVSISTLVYLLGLMALFGIELSILSVLIPPIILFVSTSDAIHLLNAYRQNTSENYVRKLQQSALKVFSPTFLTSVTTAIGFFSLCLIPTQPIKEFGIHAGLGVLIAFMVNFIFGPFLLQKNYKVKPLKLPYKYFVCFVIRHKLSVALSFFFILVVSLVGISLLKTDAYLLKDLPENATVRMDFEFVDKHFGGSKPWEMAIWPVDSSKTVWDNEFLREANKIENYLADELGMERIFSPVALLKYGYQIEKGGGNAYFQFPPAEAFESSFKNILPIKQRMSGASVVDSTGSYARFAAFIPEWGSFETKEKNEDLKSFIEQNINTDILNYRITGTTFLIDKSNETISWNLIKGLLLATALISIVLALYFKSFRMLLVSLIPNFIPLLITAGVMGYIGAPLKLTTSIIFAVAFGIAVDDTIHFLGAFKKARGTNQVWRLVKTFRSAGLSILITSILIIGGFVLFTFSSFGTTFYLGLFLSLAMLSALLCDLFLLPVLLLRKGKKQT